MPTSATGMVTLGMIVAHTLRRNTKITSTTRPIDSSRVNSTSPTEARIVCVRSETIVHLDVGRDAGQQPRQLGADAVHRVDHVGAGLLEHEQQHGRLAVLPGGELAVLRPVDRVADVAIRTGAAVAVGDDRSS